MKSLLVHFAILFWLVFFDSLCHIGVEGDNKEERRALLEFINSTDAIETSNWDGKDCCEFPGVVCYSERVSEMSMSRRSSAMTETWYPNITLLTVFVELENLALNDLRIGSNLQDFCELGKLNNLLVLDLSNNVLGGSIPQCFGDMRLLQELYISSNNIHGTIPTSLFSNRRNIYTFDVSRNRLDGLLSFHDVFRNSSLSNLDLSNNYQLEVETESIPPRVPDFSFYKLSLANCKVNKRSKNVVPSFISTQHDLEWLDLSHTSLEGSIPCWLLFSKSIATLILKGNRFNSSSFNCVANGTSPLQALDVSSNRISGLLPDNIGQLIPSLKHVNMSSNEFAGSIPRSLGRLPLEILDLSYNKFSGEIPNSLTRTGSRLVYLNLSNNRLRGEMLPRMSNMTELECLQLSGNILEGILSPAISQSPLVILDVRNNKLSGNIPEWLYDHPHLVAVLMGGNQFDGHFRRKVCDMKTLQVLDISNNHLSGGIPSCLNNIPFWKNSTINPNDTNYLTKNGRLQYLLEANPPFSDVDLGTVFVTKNFAYTFTGIPLSLMTGIDLSLNQLSGNIPPEIGELSQLRSINFSDNLLTGSIPTSFRNLKSTERLDLSHNNLTGEIPDEMVQLTSLAAFSVAYNNLTGTIPLGQQFSTFEEQCYVGNPFLCGKPLRRNCSPPETAVPPEYISEEETSVIDSSLFYYAFIAVSYAVGFWVFWDSNLQQEMEGEVFQSC